jgi:VRR-NUC domain
MTIARDQWTRFVKNGRKAQAEVNAIAIMLEHEWQAQVEQLAELCGWWKYHTFDSRKSEDGFPDLLMIRTRDYQTRLVVAELKREGEKPTHEQAAWLARFAAAGAESYFWRPSDFDQVKRVLR